MQEFLQKPTGKEKLYFLKLNSDIEHEKVGDLFLKKVTDDDLLCWFGMKVTFDNGRLRSGSQQKPIENTMYGRPIRDPVGLKLFENNYVLYGATEDVRVSVMKIDKAIRLFITGNSGVSEGFTKNSTEFFYPLPGWHQLESSKINLADLNALNNLTEQIDLSRAKNSNLLIDRYRNATQGGSAEPYNRFIDLITILEMLFVSDSRQGEIGYKLRVRGSFIAATCLATSVSEAQNILKKFYEKRSKIVHGGEHDEISNKDWKMLASICREAIVLYLKNPDQFSPEKLDERLFKD